LSQGRKLLSVIAETANKTGPIQKSLEELIVETFRRLHSELDAAAKVISKARGTSDLSSLQQTLASLRKTKKYTYHWRRDDIRKLQHHLSTCDTHLCVILQTYSL
jgi:hypothetical protein